MPINKNAMLWNFWPHVHKRFSTLTLQNMSMLGRLTFRYCFAFNNLLFSTLLWFIPISLAQEFSELKPVKQHAPFQKSPPPQWLLAVVGVPWSIHLPSWESWQWDVLNGSDSQDLSTILKLLHPKMVLLMQIVFFHIYQLKIRAEIF